MTLSLKLYPLSTPQRVQSQASRCRRDLRHLQSKSRGTRPLISCSSPRLHTGALHISTCASPCGASESTPSRAPPCANCVGTECLRPVLPRLLPREPNTPLLKGASFVCGASYVDVDDSGKLLTGPDHEDRELSLGVTALQLRPRECVTRCCGVGRAQLPVVRRSVAVS
jgi:hypothetical protein